MSSNVKDARKVLNDWSNKRVLEAHINALREIQDKLIESLGMNADNPDKDINLLVSTMSIRQDLEALHVSPLMSQV